MPRTYKRVTPRQRFWVIRSKDLPPWATEVPGPAGVDVLELLNSARYYPATVARYPQYFTALERAARSRFEKGDGGALLELLDLAPALVAKDPPEWIVRGLFRFFQERAYPELRALTRRMGKAGTDRGLLLKFLVENMMWEFVDRHPAAGESEGTLRLGEFRQRMTKEKAIEAVAQSEGMTYEAVEKALKRTHQRLRRR